MSCKEFGEREEQIINLLKGVETSQRVWLDGGNAYRLTALKDESGRPKAAAADLTIDNRMLKDMPSKK